MEGLPLELANSPQQFVVLLVNIARIIDVMALTGIIDELKLRLNCSCCLLDAFVSTFHADGLISNKELQTGFQ